MKFKRLVSFFMSLACIVPVTTMNIVNNDISIISSYADTTEDGLWEYSISMYGFIIVEGYNGSDANVTVPSEIDGYPVRTIGNDAFMNNINIRTVTLPDGITSIGDWAFAFCSYLESINLPDSLLQIRNNTFYNCGSLKSVDIPANVTSIGRYSFSGCNRLKTITIKSPSTTIDDTAFEKDVTIIYDYEVEPSVTTTQPIVSNNFSNGVYCDINGDGIANIIDLLLMKKYILGI